MLDVALAPAAIAHQQVGQRRWAFLETAAQCRGHVAGPATAADQRGLDEVMTQHMPPERPDAAQLGQAGVVGEGLGADDRIVAPVVALGAVPPGHAVGDYRAVHAPGKLLHACEQGAAVDDQRQRLDQAHVRVLLHAPGQAHDGIAGHQAVRVQDQHLRVGGAKPAHPLGNIAGLALDVVGAVAVVEIGRPAQALAQAMELDDLFHADRAAGGVGQDEEVELRQAPGIAHRLVDRLQAGHQPLWLLVVGGHQQGGAHARGGQRILRAQAQPSPTPGDDQHEAGQRADERQRHPGEQQREQGEEHHLQHAQSVGGHHPEHLVQRHQGDRRGPAEDVDPARDHVGRRRGHRRILQLAGAQRLLRHRQRRRRRHQFVGHRFFADGRLDLPDVDGRDGLHWVQHGGRYSMTGGRAAAATAHGKDTGSCRRGIAMRAPGVRARFKDGFKDAMTAGAWLQEYSCSATTAVDSSGPRQHDLDEVGPVGRVGDTGRRGVAAVAVKASHRRTRFPQGGGQRLPMLLRDALASGRGAHGLG